MYTLAPKKGPYRVATHHTKNTRQAQNIRFRTTSSKDYQAKQMIHMNYQDLFALKEKENVLCYKFCFPL